MLAERSTYSNNARKIGFLPFLYIQRVGRMEGKNIILLNMWEKLAILQYLTSLVPEPAKSTFYDFEKSAKNVY